MFGEHTEPNANTEPNLDMNSNDETLDTEFTLAELRAAVFSQNNNKSPGMDNLPSEIIKASFSCTSLFLLKLYKICIILKNIPAHGVWV